MRPSPNAVQSLAPTMRATKKRLSVLLLIIIMASMIVTTVKLYRVVKVEKSKLDIRYVDYEQESFMIPVADERALENISKAIYNSSNATLKNSTQLAHVPNRFPPSLWLGTTSVWSTGFCKSFLVDIYDRVVSICPKRITCLGSQYTKKMGACTLSGVWIKPSELYESVKTLEVNKIMKSDSVRLLAGENQCKLKSHFKEIEGYMEKYDPSLAMVKMSAIGNPVEYKRCQRWLNGTTFLYVGPAKHIYFKILSWYNLFLSLRNHGNRDYINIIRLPDNEGNFLFPELEKRLFTGAIPIEDLGEQAICMQSLKLVPWAYGCPLFRCKMDGQALKKKCLKCEGKSDTVTDLVAFRRHILSGCNLEDRDPAPKPTTITVIQRKRYERFKGDLSKKFRRIWTNSDELVEELKKAFPSVNVKGVYMETLEICEQIKISRDTDILIAMHGAGLVHLWWQPSNGKTLELVPSSQRGNAAFQTLSTLLGRKHILSTRVRESGAKVSVDVNKVIQDIKAIM